MTTMPQTLDAAETLQSVLAAVDIVVAVRVGDAAPALVNEFVRLPRAEVEREVEHFTASGFTPVPDRTGCWQLDLSAGGPPLPDLFEVVERP